MDEDLEEMRSLRLRSSGGRKNNNRDADSDDGDDTIRHYDRQAATAARSVTTSANALDRPVSLTSRPNTTSSAGADEAEAMARVMGFAGFASGNSRKARSFDIEAMVQTAREQAIRQESDDDDDGVQSIPSRPAYHKFPLPPKAASGPTLPPASSIETGPSEPKDSGLPSAEEEGNDTDEDDDNEGEDKNDGTKDEWKVPCAYDLTFEHGEKAVTALTLDPAGARFVTGSTDFEVKLWDFGGMQANLNPFRTCRPCEAHTINNLSFSNGGEQILVCSGNAQPKIIDREGYNVLECPKGFQYIKDMVATKGHISTVNGGAFSPKVKNEFMSCSDDGSVRIWTTDDKEKHKYCIKMKAANGLPTRPSTCTYSKDGKFIAAGCQDGSIQVYDLTKTSFVAPAKLIRSAHQSVGKNEHCVTCVCFSYDGKMICSRGLDGALRLWDLATPKKVVFEATGLPCLYPQTDCLFSPNDKLVITGTSVRKDAGQSKLVIYDRATWQLIKELAVVTESIIRIAWHPKLNQIFASTAEGQVKVFFDPNMSHNGALLCRTSKKRRAKLTDAVTADYIITPFALPMFKEEKQRSKQAQFERARKDPVKSRKPELPMTGPGAGGRVGQAGGTISSYLVRKLGYAQKLPDEDINPRDALLRHAEAAKNDPYWVSPAYSKTQPKTIFQTPAQVAEIDIAERARKRPKMEGP